MTYVYGKNLSRVTFSGPRGLMLGRKCVGEDAADSLFGGVAGAHREHQKYPGSRHAEPVTC